MKKVIIGLSGVLILAVAILLFTNARISDRVSKKAKTEVAKGCGKCPATTECAMVTEKPEAVANATGSGSVGCKNMACDQAKCKAAGCDMTKCKEGKCDPATCKSACAEGKGNMMSCDQAKCPMASKVK
jgi:hypothetical protein